MPAQDETELHAWSLPRLLATAQAAEPSDRIRYRDPIAAHRLAALEAVWPWLTDSKLCFFAAVVVRRVAELGDKTAGREVLIRALDECPEGFRSFLEEQLTYLGWNPPKVTLLPTGASLTPLGSGAQVNHAIADYLPGTSSRWGDVYLLHCGRFFSGKWVRENGDVTTKQNGQGCIQCGQRLEQKGNAW